MESHKKHPIALILSSAIVALFFTGCLKEQKPVQSEQASLIVQSELLTNDLPVQILKINGGGTGTFGFDLDGDRDIDGSHFGIGVSIFGDGSARGHFTCLMAGNADILGLPLMTVDGKVNQGSVTSAQKASFGGIATVNLGKGIIYQDVPFSVTVIGGGPGVGTLTLTVIGAFDGVPGDTNVGNGNYDLPTETVATGQIKME